MDQPIFLWSKCIHALESIYLRVKHMFVVSKSNVCGFKVYETHYARGTLSVACDRPRSVLT